MPLTTFSPVSGLHATHRGALRSVRLVFFLTGTLFASWAARIPTVKDQLELDDAGLAVAFCGLNLGAVLGLLLGGLVTTVFGSRRTLRVTVPLFAVSLSGLLTAGDLTGLTVAVAAFALANSVVDVAMNAHGVAVERTTGRALLSGIHARHSLGMISGSLIGAVAEHNGVPLAAHFAVVSVLVAAAAACGTRRLLPQPTDPLSPADPVRPAGAGEPPTETGRGERTAWTAERPAPPGARTVRGAGARPTARLVVLGLLAFCVALAEGAANDWAAVYLRDETGATAALAAAGFAVFAGAMFLGRLVGDRLVARFGPIRPFLAGTLTAGVCLGAALPAGSTVAGLLGLALFGFGISYTLPLILAATGSAPGRSPTRAIATVSILGYLGFFTGPALIGAVADAYGLTLGLAVPVLIVLIAASASPSLRSRR
ncbi:MFS transporter [Streptomyces sp. NBC_00239]|uniref:MFS transporter n=1 Tax=Streptomyces sp. NBC_00239 TaxID=2903640 RepID=UPI002E29FC8E|nr:MFS transporter [Streptomyces sp. NBC_00239]